MKPEDINRAIAEHCGWKPNVKLVKIISEYPGQINLRHHTDNTPPNYCGDLNAMHEAEKTLLPEDEYEFGEHIRKITKNVGPRGGHFTPNGFGCFAMAHATAAQRAEAFLRTINKWKDE